MAPTRRTDIARPLGAAENFVVVVRRSLLPSGRDPPRLSLDPPTRPACRAPPPRGRRHRRVVACRRVFPAAGQGRRLAHVEGRRPDPPQGRHGPRPLGARLHVHPAVQPERRPARRAAGLPGVRAVLRPGVARREPRHGVHRQGLHQNRKRQHAPGIPRKGPRGWKPRSSRNVSCPRPCRSTTRARPTSGSGICSA